MTASIYADVIDRLAHHLWDLKSRAQEQMPEAQADLRARLYPNGNDVVWQMVLLVAFLDEISCGAGA